MLVDIRGSSVFDSLIQSIIIWRELQKFIEGKVVPVRGVKADSRRGVAPCILNLATKCRWGLKDWEKL